MKISLCCVGKIKEKFYRDAIDEYGKRLSKYCKLEIFEVPDEKNPAGDSEGTIQRVMKKEGDAVLSLLKEDAFVIALDIKGTMLDSPGLAKKLERLGVEGKSHIELIIGGSLGLHEEVLRRADFRLSFSPMTFPHQLMRVILLEQLYRSFKIINNEPYHK